MTLGSLKVIQSSTCELYSLHSQERICSCFTACKITGGLHITKALNTHQLLLEQPHTHMATVNMQESIMHHPGPWEGAPESNAGEVGKVWDVLCPCEATHVVKPQGMHKVVEC